MRRSPGVRRPRAAARSVRERILAAAFAVFTARGFAAAGTLEIATRARVSKRALYAHFGSKQQMLIACIAARAQRMRPPAGRPAPRTRGELEAALVGFGARLLDEISDPHVIALCRLAVSEAGRSPAVAQALERYGSQAAGAALRAELVGALAAGVPLAEDPGKLASSFLSLLLEDLPLGLALGLRTRPGRDEIARRAFAAARALLRLALTQDR